MSKPLIIKCNRMFPADEIEAVRQHIIHQAEEGIVILPPGFELAEVDVTLLERLKEDVNIYYEDCSLSISENDENCQRCNQNMFGSILGMIDHYIFELKGEDNE